MRALCGSNWRFRPGSVGRSPFGMTRLPIRAPQQLAGDHSVARDAERTQRPRDVLRIAVLRNVSPRRLHGGRRRSPLVLAETVTSQSACPGGADAISAAGSNFPPPGMWTIEGIRPAARPSGFERLGPMRLGAHVEAGVEQSPATPDRIGA